jgi:hypothetical protein
MKLKPPEAVKFIVGNVVGRYAGLTTIVHGFFVSKCVVETRGG